jgi:general secretion pathway protein L
LSTLYLRLLSKAAAEQLADLGQMVCPFALVNDGGAIERQGDAALLELRPLIMQSQRVILLLSASDVSLQHMRVPPLSPSRLRAALPNLLEEKLMSDPADCVIVAGPSIDGMRTIAIVQRAWLEQLVSEINGLGARSIVAVPAQLCVPHQDGVVSATITAHSSDLDLVIRLSDVDGIGIGLLPESAASAAVEAVQTVCALVPQSPIALYVPQIDVAAYREIVADAQLHERISLFADNWLRWVTGARSTSVNLMTGLGVAAAGGLNWRPWRWAISLAVLVVLGNIIALDIDWLRMKREADGLQKSMILSYKAAYPNETAIIDPVVQIRQKIAIAQRASGQAAPDDFAALLANFSEAWSAVMQGDQALMIAGIDYRDRNLLIKLKPNAAPSLTAIKAALAAHALTLSQPNAGIWQIRSSK